MSTESDFVRPENPILRKVAKKVQFKLNSLEPFTTIEHLLDVAYGHSNDRLKPTVVELAAPQLGISKRIILIDKSANGKGDASSLLYVYINPEIIWQSEEEEEWCEGCWSTDQVCGIVSRPKKVRVRANLRNGDTTEFDLEGYSARIVQHEIDHLNGIEFVDHITDDNKLHLVEDNLWEEYKIKEGWRNWPIKCPREKWEKIKGMK